MKSKILIGVIAILFLANTASGIFNSWSNSVSEKKIDELYEREFKMIDSIKSVYKKNTDSLSSLIQEKEIAIKELQSSLYTDLKAAKKVNVEYEKRKEVAKSIHNADSLSSILSSRYTKR